MCDGGGHIGNFGPKLDSLLSASLWEVFLPFSLMLHCDSRLFGTRDHNIGFLANPQPSTDLIMPLPTTV